MRTSSAAAPLGAVFVYLCFTLAGCASSTDLVVPETVDISDPVPTHGPAPSPRQLAWQQMEQNLFIHFGLNTFTGDEWGDGTASPELFRPTGFDPEQWMRVAKEAGFEGVVFTAKHHEGFALWPTAHSDYSVRKSPWRNGQGDAVRAVADAAQAAGLAFGLYLSPWDRHEPTYGTPAYDDFYVNQLTELLTGYGPVFQVWIDGAHGEGVRPTYDYGRFHQTIRDLQPDALITLAGPDVRWIGNEEGYAPQPQWSVRGDERWYPAECPVPNRPHWFWRPEEDGRVKSLEEHVDIYFNTVGSNCVLLLGVPVNRHGRIPAPDAERLRAWKAYLDATFATNYAREGKAGASSVREGRVTWAAQNAVDGKPATFWTPADDAEEPMLELQLPRPETINVVELREAIQYGQRVEAYRIEAWNDRADAWRLIHRGSTIGYKTLARTRTVKTDRVRIVIERGRAQPLISELGLYLERSWR